MDRPGREEADACAHEPHCACARTVEELAMGQDEHSNSRFAVINEGEED